tara:strand:- start:1573 stop:1908 length:336 start_codon:yes stop_codon:yes gene_type:complete
MRRFNYDDHDDFKEEIDNFWPGDTDSPFGYDPDDEPYIEKGDIINMLQIDMVEYELNQRILTAAYKLCKSSFWWRFRTVKSKIAMVKFVYLNFVELLDRENKKNGAEEEEE